MTTTNVSTYPRKNANNLPIATTIDSPDSALNTMTPITKIVTVFPNENVSRRMNAPMIISRRHAFSLTRMAKTWMEMILEE